MKKHLLYLLLLLSMGQVIASPPSKPLPPKKALVVRVMEYFIHPEKLMRLWGNEAIPTSQYTTQEIALQKQLNDTEDGVITYSPIGAASERDIDQLPITPYTWKWVTLEHHEANGSYTKATLRRPNEWFITNGITQIGARYHLQVPAAGIDGEVIVTAISPNQLDSRFWNDHRNGDYAARPITGLFEHTRSNVVAIKLAGQEGITEVTDNHLFFSQTHNDWLPVKDLAIGEQIKTRLGVAILETKTPKVGTHTVYDLELYQDHNFLVGNAQLLVHNACDLAEAAKTGREAHRQIQKELAKDGYAIEKNVKLESGQLVRKDAVKGNEVVIIKPRTSSGIAEARIRRDLMRDNGYDTRVILYRPNNPAYQSGSSTYIGGGNKSFLQLTKDSRQ